MKSAEKRRADAEKPQRRASELGKAISKFADDKAAEIAESICEELDEVELENREDYLKFVISNELVHFWVGVLKLHVRRPDGRARLQKISGLIAARASADKRQANSVKARFLDWALEQNQRNPDRSKNDLAAQYASNHPGTSAATLRRYLGKSEIDRLLGDD